jgi:type IV pilus assembly protein PilA
MHKPRQKGFSLIELLIVVTIILIIAAIVIPNLTRARIAADEGSAVAAVRTLISAEVTYNTAYPQVGFATTLKELGTSGPSCAAPSSAAACLIDGALAGSGTVAHSGYLFNVTVGKSGGSKPEVDYTIGAAASSFNTTGIRNFCALEDGVMRYAIPTSQTPVASIDANTCIAYSTLTTDY